MAHPILLFLASLSLLMPAGLEATEPGNWVSSRKVSGGNVGAEVDGISETSGGKAGRIFVERPQNERRREMTDWAANDAVQVDEEYERGEKISLLNFQGGERIWRERRGERPLEEKEGPRGQEGPQGRPSENPPGKHDLDGGSSKEEKGGEGAEGDGVKPQVTSPEDPGGGGADLPDGSSSPSAKEEVPLEEYDYDLEESLRTFNWAELLPALVVYSLTFVFGVTGNFLIIIATTSCCRRTGSRGIESRYAAASAAGRLQTPSPTNVFLASLASADLLLILICIPVKMAKLFSYTWTMGVFLCKFVYYMQNVSTICSVLTLTAISLERYYAIVHPMKAKYTCTVGQATKIVLAIWVASILLAVPILFVQVHLSVGIKIRAYWCFRNLDNVDLWRFHEVYLLLLVLVLPTCVMAGAYASICWEIWKVMRRRYAMTCGRKGINPPMDDPLGNGGTEGGRGTESIRLSKKTSRRFHVPRRMNTESSEMESGTVRKVIKMLVTVVVLFVICWAPVLVDNVLKAYQVLPVLRDANSSLRHMGNAFHLMSYFNSCINPIVYGFMSKSFRVSFYKVLCRCCHQGRRSSGKPKRNPSTNSQSRTTSVRYTDTSSGRSMSMTTTY